MGGFTLRVLIADLTGRKTAEVDAVIDSGSHYCAVPQSLASRLGLEPFGLDLVLTADGRELSAPVAGVRVELEGRAILATTLILPDPAEPLLGSPALVGFRVVLEPTGGRLIRQRLRL